VAGGRKRIPDWMQVVAGNQRGKAARKGGRGRQPKAKPTPAPEHLSAAAKRAWEVFEPQLRAMGVFQPDYVLSLEQACELYADIRDLRKEIAKDGRFYKTTNREGHVMIRPHPAAGQLADADRRLASYLSDFGLTPAGRAKLLSTKAPDGDSDGEAPEAEFFA
jgi:P27 family predicted phage terminase small subunit